jgi:hypothetical protein
MGWIRGSFVRFGTNQVQYRVYEVLEPAGSMGEWLTPCNSKGETFAFSGIPVDGHTRRDAVVREARRGRIVYPTRADAVRGE